MSASTVARLKEKWQAVWQSRPLDDLSIKAGLEKEKAVLLVVLAALSDGSKGTVAIGDPELFGMMRDLNSGGSGCPRLVIWRRPPGHLGSFGNVYPQAEEQRCWNRRIVNLLPRAQAGLADRGRSLSREGTTTQEVFQHWCRQRGLTQAAELIEQDWDRMVTFYNYPKAVAASEPPIQPFAALRLRTDAAKRESGKRGFDLEDGWWHSAV